jgi:hypothetical protein
LAALTDRPPCAASFDDFVDLTWGAPVTAAFLEDFEVGVLAMACAGAAANDVATATDTASDRTARSAAPFITLSDENFWVFISVLFWAGE